jgi:hemoglobin-like flavoprotein
MPLTDDQAYLISESFRAVLMRKDTAAELLYQRLFELDPNLRTLFKEDLRVQGQKFIQMIGTLVGAIYEPKSYQATLAQLTKRHAGYGVQPRDYAVMGEAFVWALERVLGDTFTPQARAAWEALYDDISRRIIDMGL